MNKFTKYIATALWIIFSRAYDIYSTYKFTPDLTMEANPLVSVLSFSWYPLIIIISLIVIYALYVYYNTLFKYDTLFPQKKGLGFVDFITYLYLGRADKWTAIFYKFPSSFSRFNNLMGHILPKAFSFVGIITTIMWLLIQYTSFYKTTYEAYMPIAVILLGIIIIVYFWAKKMYREYQMQSL